jgi:hypothetical protein
MRLDEFVIVVKALVPFLNMKQQRLLSGCATCIFADWDFLAVTVKHGTAYTRSTYVGI